MNPDRVRITVEDHVADVRLVRADKHNALDGEMFLSLQAAARQLREDTSVRAVVLSGEGPSFCSGLDLMSFMSAENGTAVPDLFERPDDELVNLAQAVAYDWQLVGAPVIAALHGAVYGGGCQIALGADIRIAAPDARLCIMEIKWGLIPDMGISWTLPRLVPIDVAKELTFTGRTVSGTEADALGLVTRVADDPVAAARELAAAIASKSPDAVRRAKAMYNQVYNASSEDAGAGFLLESALQMEVIGKPNQIEAVRAGMAKEPAQFSDPTPSGVAV